jgi:hypothetical protein
MATTVILQSQHGDGAVSRRNHDDDDVCGTNDGDDVDVKSSNRGRANDKNGMMSLADGIQSVTNAPIAHDDTTPMIGLRAARLSERRGYDVEKPGVTAELVDDEGLVRQECDKNKTIWEHG